MNGPDQHRMDLPLDLLELIANRLLADDVVDYISFRAVCRDWRSLTASPRSFASQFHPRHWIMLPNFGNNPSAHVCFLNLFTGRSLVTNRFPELESHSIISVCDGLLVLLDKKTLVIRLFNPFTRHMSDDLPPLEPEYFEFPVEMLWKYEQELKHCSVMIGDNSPRPTFIFYIPCGRIISAKPGDKRWRYRANRFPDDTINTFFNGMLYYISSDNTICAMEPEKMHCSSVVSLSYNARLYPSVLVKFESNLLLVRRSGEIVPHSFEILKVDLEANALVNLDNLGEYSLLMGVNRQTIVVSSKNFPSIRGNSIYCFFLYSGSTIHYSAIPSRAETAMYNLNDQSIELLSNFHDDDLLQPRTLADYLFKHCSLPQW